MRPSNVSEDERHRAVLAEAREQTVRQIAALKRDFDAFVEGAELVNTDDEHDPEGATIAFERAQVIALRDEAESRLRHIDRALGRLDDGSYGRCLACGGQITPERLLALPGVEVCVNCAAIGHG